MCKSNVVLLDDPRFVDKAWLRENGLVSFAGYPLEFDGEILGVLAMFARRALTDLELEWLGIFAAQASVAIKNAGLFAEVTTLTRRLEAENVYLKEELGEANATGIVGRSATLGRALVALERVAPTMSTVLIHGETGTGKELFARALHEKSARKARPFVTVDCGALAPVARGERALRSRTGAFTDAAGAGRALEQADGGTLFLDEIGELPAEAQASCSAPPRSTLPAARRGADDPRQLARHLRHPPRPPEVRRLGSGRTSSLASASFRSSFRRCATGPRTYLCREVSRPREFAERMGKRIGSIAPEAEALFLWRPTATPATCASCATSSSGHRSSRARTGSASPSCPS